MPVSRQKLILLTFITEGTLLFLALFLSRIFDISLNMTEDYGKDLLTGLIGAVPPLCVFVVTVSRVPEDFPFLGALKKLVLTDVRNLFRTATLADIVIIAFMAGLAEEMMFRGVIQAKLGIMAASIIFGAVHFISPAYAVMAAIMGFYIGVFFESEKTLLVPALIHFLYDFGALVYIRFFAPPPLCREESG